MASYTYDNGIYMVTTPIYDGFHRFHGCNAQEKKLVINDEKGARFIVWQFISYNTRIAQVMRDLEHNCYIVYLHGNPYDYSRTTNKQFNRWLREKYFSHLITPMIVNRAYDECNAITPNVSVYMYGNIRIEFRSTDEFDRVWR